MAQPTTRALRAILESTMLDVMFHVPSEADIRKVVLPRGVIEKQTPPILLTEEGLPKAS